MVGQLNAPVKTRLYNRLGKEDRLLNAFSGDNTDFSMNCIPVMNRQAPFEGYRKVLTTIYSPRKYFQRIICFLRIHEPRRKRESRLRLATLRALSKSMLLLGIIGKERVYCWKLFFWSLFRRPRRFSMAITLAIYGFHFRRVFQQNL